MAVSESYGFMDETMTRSKSSSAHSQANETATRSLFKAISWRVIGTLDTFFLSYVIIKYLGPYFGAGEGLANLDIAKMASLIAVTEILTKIFLFTAHERAWNRAGWGVSVVNGRRHESRIRSVSKMAVWRVLASLDTMLLAWIFTGDISTAISIGSAEVFTKLVLYFLHERFWLFVKTGTRIG